MLPAEIVERMLTNRAPRAVGDSYGWFVLRTTRGTPLYRQLELRGGGTVVRAERIRRLGVSVPQRDLAASSTTARRTRTWHPRTP